MAIIDFENPSNYSSVHDDLWHMAQSDNANTADFKYIFDFYVGTKQVLRAKVFPNPENNKGYFNASNVISNEMKFDWFNPDGNLFSHSLNDSGEYSLDYRIQVGEEVAGTSTLNMESGLISVVNTCAPLFNRRIVNNIAPNTQHRFLSNRQREAKTNYGESFMIGMTFIGEQYPEPTLRIKKFNETGGLLGTDTITINDNLINIFQLDISPDAINGYLDDNFITDCYYYTVELQVWNGIRYTTLDVIKLYPTCAPKYDVVNLHFMNNMGLFDTARFACVNKLSMEAQRKTFEKPDYRFGNYVTYYDQYTTPADTTNKRYYETKINYGSQYQWSYHLTMDFPTDSDYEWLAELIESPIIYAEINVNGIKEFYPISIKATNYEYSKHINNGLRPFEIDIDMNLKRHGFRR